MKIDLSEDHVAILLNIYDQVPSIQIPGLNDEEKVEIALNTLLMSYDAGQEQAAEIDASPVTAEELKEHMQRVLNPDLSTVFEPPKPSDQLPKPPQVTYRPFADIKNEDPNNDYIQAADGDADMETAVAMVFSQIPKSQWALPSNRSLIASALKIPVKLMPPSKEID